jgi:hypothetical protein
MEADRLAKLANYDRPAAVLAYWTTITQDHDDTTKSLRLNYEATVTMMRKFEDIVDPHVNVELAT